VTRDVGRVKLIRPTELAVCSIVALTLGFAFDRLEAFESLVDFFQSHEDWQLDEVFFVLFFLGIGALILAIRRSVELAHAIAEREAAEARANALARHDPLTGLANRRVLQAELPSLVAQSHSRDRCAVFAIDLDHFKPINDAFGHEAGDAVLVEVAARLNQIVSDDGIVARVGGDEFVLAMPHECDADALGRTARRIIRTLSAPYHRGGRRFEIGASIGISRAPDDATVAEELLRAADVAMYDAKRAGRSTYRFFRAEMDARLRARAKLEADLREAVAEGAIIPYFQPVMSLTDQRLLGFEALARWDHPERGMIGPDDFIPIAEENRLIDTLFQRILHQSCLAARDWPADVSLSVNLSPIQLKSPWLPGRILATLQETGLAPGRLIVEVTENAIIDDIDQVAEVFASLQNVGIRVALDDFGRGYSSLSHLRQLKFNHLKIDSSFVRSMECVESREIITAVTGLGKALRMPVTAEGVETPETAEALMALGCEQAQGYLFGHPASAIDTARLCHDRAALPHPADRPALRKAS